MLSGKVYTAVAVASVLALTGAAWRSQQRRTDELQEQVRVLTQQAHLNAEALTQARNRERAPQVMVTPTSPRAEPQGTSARGEASPDDDQRRANQPADADADGSKDVPSSEDQAAYVDTVFTEESRDPAWSRESERRLDDELRARLGSSKLESLECHQTLCRVEVNHDDRGKYSEFIDGLVGNANKLWRGPIFALKDGGDEGGAVGSTIYFVKEGSQLPAL